MKTHGCEIAISLYAHLDFKIFVIEHFIKINDSYVAYMIYCFQELCDTINLKRLMVLKLAVICNFPVSLA